MRTLKRGCVGNDVMYLQYLIGSKIDGSFGPATEKDLKLKQSELGLASDGSCGPLTQSALGMTDFMVFIFDPKKDKMWVAGTPYGSASYPLKTLKQWASEEKADIAFNLAFFNMRGSGCDKFGPIKGRTLTYCRGKGKDIGYGGTTEMVVIDNDNKFSGYKLAVKDGVRKTVSATGRRARNANGILKDGRVFVVQTLSKKTELEVVSHMVKFYDVDLMLIQDSGGSVGVYFSNSGALIACEKEGTNGRPVATALCVKMEG
ncbi:MAG: hypothetical protein SOW50_07285 [Lachnospiraceae bacterium]|nr:hypothetical protein [Lachnospiraceae bacterium]